MNATGIVRRVDDLGRIIIPKEVRRQLRITDGTPMELFIEKDGVVFRKYIPEADLKKSVNDLQQAFYDIESCLDSEKAGRIEEHIIALKEIVKESED